MSRMGERNRNFDIQHVDNINHDDYFNRSGYHIRKTVAPPDMNSWMAEVPTGEYESIWEGRLIRVKGAAQDFWLRDTERYHAGIGKESKVKCEATYRAHIATEVAIEESKDGWRACA